MALIAIAFILIILTTAKRVIDAGPDSTVDSLYLGGTLAGDRPAVARCASHVTKDTICVQQQSSRRQLKGDNDASTTEKSICMRLYGKRRFLPIVRGQLPPLLYTFPGSGNTWCRLLIEYATGIYSGSVYYDKSLRRTLPGEAFCNVRVSVVKAHPFTHSALDLREGTFISKRDKCKYGEVAKFERAILVIRNPYNAIWSEYQRQFHKGDHVQVLTHASFNRTHWEGVALHLAKDYQEMWAVHYHDLETHWHERNILFVHYEDLAEQTTRMNALRSIVKFINISEPEQDRMRCSFLLADDPTIKRHIQTAGKPATTLFNNSKSLAPKTEGDSKQVASSCNTTRTTSRPADILQPQQAVTDVNDARVGSNEECALVTKAYAYTPEQVNSLWQIFGKHAARFGYSARWT